MREAKSGDGKIPDRISKNIKVVFMAASRSNRDRAVRHFMTGSSSSGVASQIWMDLRVLGPNCENAAISRFPSDEKEIASTSPWRLNASSCLPDLRLQSVTSLSPLE